MEQPTIFYATVFIIGLSGATDALATGLAWAYVLLRIVHSLVQATFNRVAVRFAVFGASSLCLLILALQALRATLL